MAYTCARMAGVARVGITALCLGAAPAMAQATTQPVSPPLGTMGQAAAMARARADSARYPYTAADVKFMAGMMHHHAQAIVMSQWAPTHGANATVQTLCARIINAQSDEIAAMQRWLRDRNQPVPEVMATAMAMPMSGAAHDMAMPGMTMPSMVMPGMLTEAQMKALDAARGTAFDQLFLTGMIQHHKGAVSMVEDLFATPAAAQDELVFKFASDVQVDQRTEIARMERMLFALAIAGH